MLTRRSLLKFLLATPAAALVDYEQLLWVPKPIITVPARWVVNYDEIFVTTLQHYHRTLTEAMESSNLFLHHLLTSHERLTHGRGKRTM